MPGFEQRVRDLVLDLPAIAAVIIPLLAARSALRVQLAKLHKMLLDEVRADPVCRRLMTAPGVGPVVALTYHACVDNPARFSRSKCVGAHYGLTSRLYQSGETARIGRVSKCGDAMMRAALYEAALVLLTGSRRRWSTLKAWGMSIAKRRGMQKAVVAVARKLAIVLHRMWRDGTGLPVVGGPGSLSSSTSITDTELLQRGGGPCGDDGSGRDRGNLSARQT